jgi:phage/conjugal plasmid C-4 type zinc finger TraR family protein
MGENLMDYMDHAQEKAELLLAKQIEEFRAKNGFKGISSRFCKECGCSIPEKRRQLLAGVKLCFDCQAIAELKQKSFVITGTKNDRV